MELSALYRYPVKSLAGEAPSSMRIGPRGPVRDRHWMVVDPEGRFLTQREHPRMCLITAELHEGDTLTLTAPDATPLRVSPGAGSPIEVVIWQDTVAAIACEGDADLWLSDYLDTECRLVRLGDDSHRAVDPAHALATDQVGFADGFPFLLISQASLDDLGARMERELSMLRFRPNLVVAGCDSFAEDTWKRLRIGEIEFRVAKPCTRCAIPTLDPLTGSRDPAVMRTLMGYRRRDRQVEFGQNLLHDGEGVLRCGMAVEVLE
jgi:uncharacterized protein YcbX